MIRSSARSIVAACLVLAASSAASASTVALATPPLAANPAASLIFDAMLAISRTSVIDPRRADRGAAPYAAAIQAYGTGDLAGAQQNALAALVALDTPAKPLPTSNSPVVSPAPPVQYPSLVSVSQSESEERLALARRSMLACGAPTGAAFTTAQPLFEDAVKSELAHNPDAVNADVQSIVDACAAATPVATGSAP